VAAKLAHSMKQMTPNTAVHLFCADSLILRTRWKNNITVDIRPAHYESGRWIEMAEGDV